MATAIIPKSQIRKEGKDAIIHGYAELPSIYSEGKVCWALPGNRVECDPDKAKQFAAHLDSVIQQSVKKTGRPLL